MPTASSRSTRRPSVCAGWCRRCASRSRTAQMDDSQLEQRMLTFPARRRGCPGRDVDHRVGIDIPQANTLIVERADMFGLSQLYQIRGRVGRSRERAYAYLLYPSAAALTAEAAQRAIGTERLHRARGRLQGGGCATSRSGAPATCWETSIRACGGARLRAVHADARRGGAGRPGGRLRAQRRRRSGSPCGSRSASTRTYPLTTSLRAGEGRRAPPHRRRARGREIGLLREELIDRFGEVPEPLENLLLLQIARIKLGQAGATTVSFKADAWR